MDEEEGGEDREERKGGKGRRKRRDMKGGREITEGRSERKTTGGGEGAAEGGYVSCKGRGGRRRQPGIKHSNPH